MRNKEFENAIIDLQNIVTSMKIDNEVKRKMLDNILTLNKLNSEEKEDETKVN